VVTFVNVVVVEILEGVVESSPVANKVASLIESVPFIASIPLPKMGFSRCLY